MQVKYKALDSTWFKWKLPHCNTLIVESLNGNVNGNEEMVVSQIFVTIYDNMAMGQRYVIVLWIIMLLIVKEPKAMEREDTRYGGIQNQGELKGFRELTV